MPRSRSRQEASNAGIVETTQPALDQLIDHIAAELAAEYVRLMETAAEGERSETSPAPSEVVIKR